ncbi:Aquaglycerol porin AQY3 [Psilocybe cubensis]|uniref:Aquaporin n=2 Tax=Psilocybe cubensis TaxID=181762 RepID=A0A8H7XS60_PSICU|nr:Aquaglycerol porin AQY3 [Psilocybe cubensis]KAH9474742.1 Aquaglycerol porin AQY3 [Psilocybe cubensis]
MQSPTSSITPTKPSGDDTPPANVELPTLASYFPPQKSQSTMSRLRQFIREPMAEFFGVALFVIFGTGVDCQVVLSTNKGVAASPKGDFLSVNFGWAIGLAMGAWVSGGISGGHLNPAVTLALATWRGFPWRKVPAFIFAQVMGGLVGAAIVYRNYINAIDIFEGGRSIRTQATAGLFATYAQDYMTAGSCFFVEFLGTAILVFVVVAVTDKNNNAPPSGLLPVSLFLVLLGLGASLGMQTSYAFNPARDFGPRLLLTFAGYGKQLYSYRHQYWLWCPIIAPFVGAQAAVGFYDLFLREEDPFNRFESPKSITNDESGTQTPAANGSSPV